MNGGPKGRRGGREGQLDDWLMTYADMITLLLCFFAIFLAMSVPKQEQFEEAQQRVMEQFASEPNNNQIVAQMGVVSDSKGGGTFEELQSIVDLYQLHREVNIYEEEGVITIEINSGLFFPSGAADLNEEGKWFLSELLKNFKKPEFADYLIAVEGHTDDSPIKTAAFPTNWELSTGRATRVVRFMLENGVPSQRLRASGYADAFPKVPNKDVMGRPIPDNQAKNRRVIIKLEKIKSSPAYAPLP